jgi:hypothetical protein
MKMSEIEFCINYSEEDSEKEIQGAITEHIENELAGSEFLVCDDENADEKVKDYIRESLWAFNTEFILSHSNIENVSDKLEKSLKKVQGDCNEDCNELMLALIKDFDYFVEDAIDADGRGHFLNTYDNEENEFEYKGKTYYIYRTN